VEGRASTIESMAKAGATKAATGTAAAPLIKASLVTDGREKSSELETHGHHKVQNWKTVLTRNDSNTLLTLQRPFETRCRRVTS